MTIKDIQVHVDNDKACGKRVESAVKLAGVLDAHLAGVYIRKVFPFPVYSMMPTSSNVVGIYDQILDDRESEAHGVFNRHIGPNTATVSWRVLTGSISYELANEARCCDLLVLGQANPSENESLDNDLEGQLIFTAGRPCLIIPYAETVSDWGKSPLIAWDGSREATRAVHDALPLLKLAGRVTILVVEPEKMGVDFGDFPGVMISEHLARHDINVTVEVSRGSPQSTGETILSYIDANAHDLLIMGAYGHSRWREMILGGVTRTIMKTMTVPVLLSH
jgi:nucleotide-binding universal stress UspA family protein